MAGSICFEVSDATAEGVKPATYRSLIRAPAWWVLLDALHTARRIKRPDLACVELQAGKWRLLLSESHGKPPVLTWQNPHGWRIAMDAAHHGFQPLSFPRLSRNIVTTFS